MSRMMTLDVFTAIVLVTLFTALCYRSGRGRLRYPPGPRGLPLIGHFLTFPKNFVWLTFTQWGRQYGRLYPSSIKLCADFGSTGEIVSVKILGQVIIILNSPKAAKELLEKRGNIYSDRHLMPFYQMYASVGLCCSCDLRNIRMGWEWFHPTTPYGDYWREGRRILDRSLRPGAVVQYRPMQLAKTHDFLYQLLSDPESFHRLIGL